MAAYIYFKFTDASSNTVSSEIITVTSVTYTLYEKAPKCWDTLDADAVLDVELYVKDALMFKSPLVIQVDELLPQNITKVDHAVTERRDMARKRADSSYTKRASWQMYRKYDYFRVSILAKTGGLA